jgi:hypothetical protein
VYLDYGLPTERLLAPTRGGNSFTVEQEIRQIERDGALGKEKEMRRVITEDAMMTVRLLDLSIANLKLCLAGAKIVNGVVSSTTDGVIDASEYFGNVTLVGVDLEGKNRVITLANPLADNGLSVDFTDKDEAVLEVQFSGHRNPFVCEEPLYTIEDVEEY